RGLPYEVGPRAHVAAAAESGVVVESQAVIESEQRVEAPLVLHVGALHPLGLAGVVQDRAGNVARLRSRAVGGEHLGSRVARQAVGLEVDPTAQRVGV